MTTETRHHPSGPLKLAITLAACAGFVDAHVYLNVTPVFVANMSGNLIHLGMFTGLGDWREAVASIVAFAGVAASIVHHDHQIQRGLPIGPSRLLAVEATLVVALSLLVARLHVGFTAQPSPRDLPILLIGGVAMGLQAGSLRRVGEISVATTYGTGAIVRIGEKVALGARGADRVAAHRRRVTIAVLAIVLCSYVAGAIAAAIAGPRPALLIIPGMALAASSAASHRWPSVRGGDRGGRSSGRASRPCGPCR